MQSSSLVLPVSTPLASESLPEARPSRKRPRPPSLAADDRPDNTTNLNKVLRRKNLHCPIHSTALLTTPPDLPSPQHVLRQLSLNRARRQTQEYQIRAARARLQECKIELRCLLSEIEEAKAGLEMIDNRIADMQLYMSEHRIVDSGTPDTDYDSWSDSDDADAVTQRSDGDIEERPIRPLGNVSIHHG